MKNKSGKLQVSRHRCNATWRFLLSFVFISAFLQGQLVYAEERAFKYRNSDGVVVINSSIPPEYVDKGYEIINPSTGTVIEVVPPALTPDELKEAKRKAEQVAAQEREKEKQRQYDLRLLTLYSEPNDAVRAYERRIKSTDLAIERYQADLASKQSRKNQLTREAADLERAGKEVDPQLIESLKAIEESINVINRLIESQHDEKKKIRLEFESTVYRLEELLNYEHDATRFDYLDEPTEKQSLSSNR